MFGPGPVRRDCVIHQTGARRVTAAIVSTTARTCNAEGASLLRSLSGPVAPDEAKNDPAEWIGADLHCDSPVARSTNHSFANPGSFWMHFVAGLAWQQPIRCVLGLSK